MKISNDTLQIIKNFATINTNILFREGNVISTISTGKNIFARAVVAEEFEKEFAVYDLNSLLALLSLAEDQDIELGDKSLIIKKDGGKFEYYYSDPSIVVAAPDKTPTAEGFYTFQLTAQEVQTITKAAAIVGASTLSVIGKDGKVTLQVGDPKTPSSNSYRKVLGESEDEFDARLSFDNFKIIPDSYTVTVSKKKFLHFKHVSKDLAYWLALDPSSVL